MTQIVLHNGTVHDNIIGLGWNLSAEGIRECLQETGKYDLWTANGRIVRLISGQVKEIAE